MQKQISAKRVLVTSFAVDTLDIILNLTVAVITGSVVMFAEMLQGITDLITTGFLLIGFTRSKIPVDKTHPFGHGREIYFWILLASLVMFFLTAGLSFYFGLKRFLNPQIIGSIYLAYGTLAIGILTNAYSLSLGARRLLKGEKVTSIFDRFLRSSKMETKAAFVQDLIGTLSGILGLTSLVIYKITGDLRFDGVGAMVIAVTLAMLSFLLLLGIRDFIVGKSASKATEEKIVDLAISVEGVLGVLDLKTTYVGPSRVLVNLEVHLKNDLHTNDIEKIIDEIKRKITEGVPEVFHIQVEPETP